MNQTSDLWNLGFRPFFLFGVGWSALQIVVWAAFQAGWVHSVPYLDPLVWHAHEMIFGYGVAIIAGFLLTASQNWTGIPGVRGVPLLTLTALWGTARVLSVFWSEAPIAFALVDLAFLPALAWALKPYLWRKSQNHNKVFFLLFFFLFLLNLLVHLDGQGFRLLPARSALLGAIHCTVILVAFIAGRVLPFFSRVVLPDVKPSTNRWIEVGGYVSLVAFTVTATGWEFSPATAAFALAAAILQAIRLLLWKPWRLIGIPVLFILYVAYFWIPLGLLFRAMAAQGVLPASVATHAFSVGCIGTMIYGMITRVSLGHTGRPIKPAKVIVLGYILISLSAVARVFGPLFFREQPVAVYEISGWIWVAAHLIFLAIYGPILCRPRADGKAG
jgi:uncharacterized protein involved in response to NO